MSGMLKNNYPSLSRREFLTTAVGAGGAMLLGPAWLYAAADAVDPRIAQLMSRTIGTLMPAHPLPAVAASCLMLSGTSFGLQMSSPVFKVMASLSTVRFRAVVRPIG